MADLGGKLIVLALEQAVSGRLKPVRQPEAGVTYAHKIEKHEAAIDWHLDATAIVRRVRAFNPFPGAAATLNGETIKVWGALVGPVAEAPPGASNCGRIVAVAPDGIAVAAMNSVAILTELQRPGGKRLAVADFLRGFEVHVGMHFDLAVFPATQSSP
jgi:methionyl-tRNA formyltransferase